MSRTVAESTDPPVRLPPGPPLPRWAQTLGFILGGARFLELCRRRYGGAVYLRTLFDNGFVMLFDPALVKELFQGPHEQLNAGEANALLGPILGERSVLVLDGAEHLRHRKLMLPPFHGRRMQAYERAVEDAADAEIAAWPTGEPFALLPSMQSLTLRVVVRAVFGYAPGPEEARLRHHLREMITPVGDPRGMLSLLLLPRLGVNRRRRQFEVSRAAVDRLLYAEITRRREQVRPDADDVFSALLLAEDEHGERLTDQEVRDELVTLLVAGHETTATGLAWALDLLLHDAQELERARRGDDAHLDAVVKEALRLRPVIPGVGRVGHPGRRRDQPVDPDDPRPRRSLPPARRVSPKPPPQRGRPRHLHVGAVRRRHAPVPGRELRPDGDAGGAAADPAAGGAAPGQPPPGPGAVPRHHARAPGGGAGAGWRRPRLSGRRSDGHARA
jgi:cytochrome P450